MVYNIITLIYNHWTSLLKFFTNVFNGVFYSINRLIVNLTGYFPGLVKIKVE